MPWHRLKLITTTTPFIARPPQPQPQEDSQAHMQPQAEEDQYHDHSINATTPPSLDLSTTRGYPNVVATPYTGPLYRRPFAARLFPHPDDGLLTSSIKLGNVATGLSLGLASARGGLAAILAPHARRTAFLHGFAATFPIYFPAFLLGAFADHALRKGQGEERQRRTYEYDLP